MSKKLLLPAFFPDATYGTIHSVPLHLLSPTIPGIIVTTLHYHLLNLDAVPLRKRLPLLQDKIILSDSGGFQVLSLIHNSKKGKITKEGAFFNFNGIQVKLTPEKSQEIQHNIGSDIRVVLDYPLMGHETKSTIKKSVEITTAWAKRAKDTFLQLLGISNKEFAKTSPVIKTNSKGQKYIQFDRPLLFAVVQGGNSKEFRELSARQLTKIGFDGYGFGGWPLTPDGKFNTEIIKIFANSLPKNKILYGMGIGTPDDIAKSVKLGLTLFDCVIPTRNARHGLLYVTKGNGETYGKHFDVLRIRKQEYNNDLRPLDSKCNCPVCQSYTRSYIRFLLKQKNPVGFTLASLHNLYFYSKFIKNL